MSYDIMKYLSFETRLSERKLTEKLMGEVRYLIRTHQWNTYQTLEEWQRDSKHEQDYTEVKTFFLHYKGKEMLAIVLFLNNQSHVLPYDPASLVCCVFADDYAYTSQSLSFQKLWNMKLLWNEEIFDNLSKYNAMCPKAGLACISGML